MGYRCSDSPSLETRYIEKDTPPVEGQQIDDRDNGMAGGSDGDQLEPQRHMSAGSEYTKKFSDDEGLYGEECEEDDNDALLLDQEYQHERAASLKQQFGSIDYDSDAETNSHQKLAGNGRVEPQRRRRNYNRVNNVFARIAVGSTCSRELNAR